MADISKLKNLKTELKKSDSGDTFRHGEVVDKILIELIDAELERSSLSCKWIENGDSYGKSWFCDTCGKCVFYEPEKPKQCIKGTDAVIIPGFKK